jgi:hypothetical protein
MPIQHHGAACGWNALNPIPPNPAQCGVCATTASAVHCGIHHTCSACPAWARNVLPQIPHNAGCVPPWPLLYTAEYVTPVQHAPHGRGTSSPKSRTMRGLGHRNSCRTLGNVPHLFNMHRMGLERGHPNTAQRGMGRPRRTRPISLRPPHPPTLCPMRRAQFS